MGTPSAERLGIAIEAGTVPTWSITWDDQTREYCGIVMDAGRIIIFGSLANRQDAQQAVKAYLVAWAARLWEFEP